MQNLTMVDLKSQYLKIKNEVDMAISEVIDSTAFIKGPAVNQFEDNLAKYSGAEHVIGCANGTDALQIAMMALGLKPGDEVITASFTYVATAEVIALLGLKPILVDVHPKYFTIDPESIRDAITERTKAIVPIHLFGQCADMDTIMKIANEHNLFVIEDNAQAIGAVYTFSDGSKKQAGTIGTIGTTSFFPSKNLGCFGDGGAIFTNDKGIADNIRMIANHGQKVRYYHGAVGVNSRLDTIQAAILNVKLKHLNRYSAARNMAAEFYDNAFSSSDLVQTPARYQKSTHVFHQYTSLLDPSIDRDSLISYLRDKSIPSMVYYPVPLHKQEAYSMEGEYAITEDLCKKVISLPIHTEMDTIQLEYIAVEFLLGLKAVTVK